MSSSVKDRVPGPLFRAPSTNSIKPPRPKTANAALQSRESSRLSLDFSSLNVSSSHLKPDASAPELNSGKLELPVTSSQSYKSVKDASVKQRPVSSKKAKQPAGESVNEFLYRFRRPSLPEISHSLISESSIISCESPKTDGNENALLNASECSFESVNMLDSTASYDCEADVHYAVSRIEKRRTQFKERFIPMENKEFDFSQLSKEEARQQILEYKRQLKAEKERVVRRNWKEAAEQLKPRYSDQVERAHRATQALLQSWKETGSTFQQNSTEVKSSPIQNKVSKNATIKSVFGDEKDYHEIEDDTSQHRRARRHHHHHHKYRRKSSTNLNSSEGARMTHFSDSEESIPSYSATDSDSDTSDSEMERIKEYEKRMQTESTTLPEIKHEQKKIIEAIDEWAAMKERNYAGKHYDVINTKMHTSLLVSKGEGTFSHRGGQDDVILLNEIADASFLVRESNALVTFRGGEDNEDNFQFVRMDSNQSHGIDGTLDDIKIDAIHEDHVPYQKIGLDDKNYFGEAAKLRFFGRFQQVRANQHKKSITSKRMDGTTKFEIDTSKLALLSPRTRFLTRYVTLFDSPPLPIIVRLDSHSHALDLSDMQLGDNYILLLSEVLNELPRVTVVNLKNNHLTDVSIQPLIETLSMQTHITELDLSMNKIDGLSAKALEGLIRAKRCPLKCLKLGHADISDSELSLFTAAFEVNNSIVQLDMSGNMLGASENRNDYGGSVSFVNLLQTDGHMSTAGKSIASALMLNKGIKHLDLSWNKLAALSASHMSAALSYTKTLTFVNLAYNNIRDVGAEALASSLFENGSIKTLDVSYNGISAEGCIYFAASLKVNSVLEHLNMSGNPIGDLGGIALIHCINYQSVQREMSIHSCTYPPVNSYDEKFPRLLFPSRRFVLNMKLLRDRVVAIELYRLASIRRGYVFKKIEHVGPDKKGVIKKKQIILQRPQNPAEHMGQSYGTWSANGHRHQHPYCHLSADDWMSIVSRLELVDASTGWPWQIPLSGTLTIDFMYYPRVSCPIDVLNSTGLRRLIIMLSNHRKTMVDLLRLCTQSIILESEQLSEIVRELSAFTFGAMSGDSGNFKPQEILEVFIRLLPCVRDVSNVDALIQQTYPVRATIRDIQLNLRNIYYPLVQSYSGHYKLDLGDSLDRQCGIRLAEIDAEENFYMATLMPTWRENKGHSFTAQGRTARTNFRNAVFHGAKIVLTDDFFKNGLEDHGGGVLEFDYISTTRPAIDVKVVTDSDLNGLLVARGLRDSVFGTQAAMDPSLLSHMEDEHIVSLGSSSTENDDTVSVASSGRKSARRSGVVLNAGSFGSVSMDADDQPTTARRSSGSGESVKMQIPKKPPPKAAGILQAVAAMSKMSGKGKPASLSGKARNMLNISTDLDAPEDEADEDNDSKQAKRISPGGRRGAIVHVNEAHPLTFGGLQQVSRAASSFLRKFRQMKARLGSWLAHDKYQNPDALMESLHVHGEFLTKPLNAESISIIHREVVKQDALYYAGDSLHRFVVRVSIRIHSKDILQISKSRAYTQQLQEFQHAQALKKKLMKKGKKSGKGIDFLSLDSEGASAARDGDMPFELQYYGSILEACCVYHVSQDHETGDVVLRHTGQHPYSNFVAHQPLETIPYIRLKPATIQQGLRSDPTHRRFKLYEDVSINGTEIVIRVKCTHWSSMKKIQDYAKTFLNKIFPAYRVRPTDIKTTAQSSCEIDDDAFLDPRLSKSVITHVVHHQMDVAIEQIPFAKKSLIKIPVATVDVGSMKSMGSVIFGRTTSSRDGNGNNNASSVTPKGSRRSPKEGQSSPTGFGRVKSTRESGGSSKPANPEVGKLYIVWRWRDIDDSDRDSAIQESVKMEYAKRFYELRSICSRVWLTAKQATSIVKFFPVIGKDGRQYREEAIVTLFSRITDIDNFSVVVDTLPPNYHNSVYNRIGWMNAVNMLKICRYVDLDLRVDDNRRLAQCIVTLFTGGGGLQLIEQKFRRTFENDFIPGWEIPAMWDASTYTGNLPKGIPTDGNFIATLIFRDEPDKRERYLKVRQKMIENTLLAVPRTDGSDLHLKTGHNTVDKETVDWDYLKR